MIKNLIKKIIKLKLFAKSLFRRSVFKKMTKEELNNECKRLFSCKTINDSCDLIDIYIEFLFKATKNHHKDPINLKIDSDAKMILRMMLSKALYLKRAVYGITYKSKDGSSLNKIIDPTIVASLVRNIYETTAMFNLIYRNTKSVEEKRILHLLWKHSGLTYRQRFESDIETKKNQDKLRNEKAVLDDIASNIESSELYKKLDDKNKNKIKTKLKEKDYLIRFENNEVVFLHWHELTNIMGINEISLDNIYTYFSLYSHPSYVAVFQFAEMFEKNEFLGTTNFNLSIAFFMFSIFIADYINLFPLVLKTYNLLETRDQIVINYYNTLSRGDDYSINDSRKAIS